MLKVTGLNGAEPGFEPCLISKAGFFFSAVLSVVIDHHAPPPGTEHRSLISLACLSTSLSFSQSFSLSACVSPLPLSLSALVGLLTLVVFFFPYKCSPNVSPSATDVSSEMYSQIRGRGPWRNPAPWGLANH